MKDNSVEDLLVEVVTTKIQKTLPDFFNLSIKIAVILLSSV